ncbi:MAG: hypothetical protein U9R47_01115, partial [Actinomycetota bacterium]|nr:hypothetical protein [Actinomycetota bacterium]
MTDRIPGEPDQTRTGEEKYTRTQDEVTAWSSTVGPKTAPAAGQMPDSGDSARLEEIMAREGLEITHLTQWQLIRRKFFQHKLAVISMAVLLIVVLG